MCSGFVAFYLYLLLVSLPVLIPGGHPMYAFLPSPPARRSSCQLFSDNRADVIVGNISIQT